MHTAERLCGRTDSFTVSEAALSPLWVFAFRGSSFWLYKSNSKFKYTQILLFNFIYKNKCINIYLNTRGSEKSAETFENNHFCHIGYKGIGVYTYEWLEVGTGRYLMPSYAPVLAMENFTQIPLLYIIHHSQFHRFLIYIKSNFFFTHRQFRSCLIWNMMHIIRYHRKCEKEENEIAKKRKNWKYKWRKKKFKKTNLTILIFMSFKIHKNFLSQNWWHWFWFAS